MKHIPDGGDFFAPEHAQMHRDFGFQGSAGASEGPGKGAWGSSAHPPFAAGKDTKGFKSHPEPAEEGGGNYAHGGHIGHHPHGGKVVHEHMLEGGGKVCHYSHGGYSIHHKEGGVTHHGPQGDAIPVGAHGAEFSHGGHAGKHPHGHSIVHTETQRDGGVIHHHSHGGMTIHHPDGHVEHYDAAGGPASTMPHMGVEHMHDASEHVHRAKGGRAHPDEAQDRKLIGEMMREHDGGRDHKARGGMPSLPRDMKPAAERHHSPIGGGKINTPPRHPGLSTSPHNAMPGGQMAYGMQPSAEPDQAGSEQGIPQLRHGGRPRR